MLNKVRHLKITPDFGNFDRLPEYEAQPLERHAKGVTKVVSPLVPVGRLR